MQFRFVLKYTLRGLGVVVNAIKVYLKSCCNCWWLWSGMILGTGLEGLLCPTKDHQAFQLSNGLEWFSSCLSVNQETLILSLAFTSFEDQNSAIVQKLLKWTYMFGKIICPAYDVCNCIYLNVSLYFIFYWWCDDCSHRLVPALTFTQY